MFLNYPNNPTSATAPLSFYEDTVEFAIQNQIVVASDFAYGAIGFDGHRPVSFLQALVPKKWALSSIRYPKRTIWLDGVLDLR